MAKRRYVRNVKSGIKGIAGKAEKIRRVIGLPKTATCKVCYKRRPLEDLIWQDGRGMGHRGGWQCIEHNSSYQLFPEKFMENFC